MKVWANNFEDDVLLCWPGSHRLFIEENITAVLPSSFSSQIYCILYRPNWEGTYRSIFEVTFVFLFSLFSVLPSSYLIPISKYSSLSYVKYGHLFSGTKFLSHCWWLDPCCRSLKQCHTLMTFPSTLSLLSSDINSNIIRFNTSSLLYIWAIISYPHALSLTVSSDSRLYPSLETAPGSIPLRSNQNPKRLRGRHMTRTTPELGVSIPLISVLALANVDLL